MTLPERDSKTAASLVGLPDVSVTGSVTFSSSIDSDDEWLLTTAVQAAHYSTDLSTQNGATILTASQEVVNGWNRIVGLVRPDRQARPAKYQWTEHAGRNKWQLKPNQK